jgi:hypothetical protein
MVLRIQGGMVRFGGSSQMTNITSSGARRSGREDVDLSLILPPYSPLTYKADPDLPDDLQ